jgi:hypothetical protein
LLSSSSAVIPSSSSFDGTNNAQETSLPPST